MRVFASCLMIVLWEVDALPVIMMHVVAAILCVRILIKELIFLYNNSFGKAAKSLISHLKL